MECERRTMEGGIERWSKGGGLRKKGEREGREDRRDGHDELSIQ